MSKLCYVCSLVCEFKGEFVRTLEAVKEKVKQEKIFSDVVFVFPKDAKGLGYMVDFEKQHTVYFIEKPARQPKKKLVNFVKGLCSVYNKQIVNQLNEIITKESVSTIHSHFEEYDFECYAVAKKHKLNCFIHFHDALIDAYKQLPNKLYGKLKLWLIKRKYRKLLKYAKLIAVSEYSFNQLKEFVKSKNIILLKNRIDLNYIKTKENFNSNIQVFGSIVTREPKGLSTILEAAKILKQQSIDCKFKLICTDATKQVILAGYKDLVDCGTIEIFNVFENFNEFLNQIDCYISASHFETFSYGIAEALRFGVPCIISDIPSTLWAVESKNAILFNLKDATSLATKIAETIKRGNNIDNCKYASKFIGEEYNLNKLTNEICEIYTKGN